MKIYSTLLRIAYFVGAISGPRHTGTAWVLLETIITEKPGAIIPNAKYSKHDAYVQSFADSWGNQRVEAFLDANPNVRDPIPLGGDRYRYTLVHDVTTGFELLELDVFCKIYVFVNEHGRIYKVEWERDAIKRWFQISKKKKQGTKPIPKRSKRNGESIADTLENVARALFGVKRKSQDKRKE